MGALTALNVSDASDEDLPMLVFHAIVTADDDELPVPQEHIYFAELLNYEIGNGGLVQYFHNTLGEHVAKTIDALRAIGAAAHLAVFELAVSQWEIERAGHEEQWRSESVEAFADSYKSSGLSVLDDRWYETPIEPIEAAYIRENVESFVRSA